MTSTSADGVCVCVATLSNILLVCICLMTADSDDLPSTDVIIATGDKKNSKNNTKLLREQVFAVSSPSATLK